MNAALAAYDVLCESPVHLATQEGPGRGRPAHGAIDTRAVDGQPRSADGRRRHRRQHQSRSGRGARHAAADSATDGERPSPPEH
jgi:hypothetical protein